MGSLTLPLSRLVYVDTMTVIYTVERLPNYSSLLQPLWLAAQSGIIGVVTSELTLIESLVGPLKNRNIVLEAAFEMGANGLRTGMMLPGPAFFKDLLVGKRMRSVRRRAFEGINGAKRAGKQLGHTRTVANNRGQEHAPWKVSIRRTRKNVQSLRRSERLGGSSRTC